MKAAKKSGSSISIPSWPSMATDCGLSNGTTVTPGPPGTESPGGDSAGISAVATLTAETADTALARAGLGHDDLDWLVPHQANIRIIEGTAKKMGLPMEKVVLTVQDHGNTSAASIPLAMSVGKKSGKLKPGDLVVTEAIGGGLAWGAVVLRW